MECLVRKSLNVREKCFEDNVCPFWLLSILPVRIKSVESIVENECEQDLKLIDLSPYKLLNRISLLNKEKAKDENVEYPHQSSFICQQLNNYSQFIYSPSNEQLIYLLNQLKKEEKEKEDGEKKKINLNENECEEMNCIRRSIPLTRFCKIHLNEKDKEQILFVKCHFCDEIIVKEDKNNILHFCSYLI
jgi:hypothetical protein